MNTRNQSDIDTNDPLGLGQLDDIQPNFDGWGEIESALKNQQANKTRWRQAASWLAVAASLVLVVGLSMRSMLPNQPGNPSQDFSTVNHLPQLATTSDNAASLSVNDATAGSDMKGSTDMENADTIASLVGLSNKMQAQVRQMRQQTASMPAESAMYVAELEDLIAQVDNELSYTPDSIDLWGQRVNLLLDLAQIYQQQWQLDYGRMASL